MARRHAFSFAPIPSLAALPPSLTKSAYSASRLANQRVSGYLSRSFFSGGKDIIISLSTA
jgi:hypothetical protein